MGEDGVVNGGKLGTLTEQFLGQERRISELRKLMVVNNLNYRAEIRAIIAMTADTYRQWDIDHENKNLFFYAQHVKLICQMASDPKEKLRVLENVVGDEFDEKLRQNGGDKYKLLRKTMFPGYGKELPSEEQLASYLAADEKRRSNFARETNIAGSPSEMARKSMKIVNRELKQSKRARKDER